jgi:hypothetical protein
MAAGAGGRNSSQPGFRRTEQKFLQRDSLLADQNLVLGFVDFGKGRHPRTFPSPYKLFSILSNFTQYNEQVKPREISRKEDIRSNFDTLPPESYSLAQAIQNQRGPNHTPDLFPVP